MVSPDRSDGALPHFPGWTTVEKLGEGGMCEVYRCRPERGDGPERAVKLLVDKAKSSVQRFTEEARLLQRIDHPNVVKVHQLVAEPLPPWLVMDLLGGRDLEETMRTEGPMDPERCARMFADLASGLAAVHAQGVRHRDLKPANIRLGADGVPRLIDFGIARDASAARVTKAGFVVGTASYLPPEIFEDDESAVADDSDAGDVYALGQTMCEVLAGRPVHGGDRGNEASVFVRIMRDKLEREWLDPRDFGARVPEALATLVRSATAREPAQRIGSARELERALRGFLEARVSRAAVAPVSRFPAAGGLAPPTFPPIDTSIPPAPAPADPTLGAAATVLRNDPAPASAPPPPEAEAGSSRATTAVAATAAVAGFGAIGVAGMALIAAGVVVAALLGVGVWRWQVAAAEEAVTTDARRLRGELAACHGPRSPSSLTVRLEVRGGRTRRVDVVEDAPDRVTRCVEQVFRAATWSTDATVALELPVDFR